MDVTILLEDDKPVSVNEAPDYPEDVGADLKERGGGMLANRGLVT